MTTPSSGPNDAALSFSPSEWQDFLDSLYERDDRLERREAGGKYREDETVDSYVMSGHAEALQSAEVDGDLWGTLEDIDEEARTEEEAWAKICDFYLARGCVLVRVTDVDEPEEWIFEAGLLRRLGLLG